MKFLILTEKTTAANNFSKALGGQSGFLPNSTDSYDIVAADGHLLELPKPEDMVTHDKLYIYKNWSDLSLFPWNQDDFNWKKRVIYGKQKYIDTIRKASLGHDAIIVATDYDPTGEGAVLAYEILEEIGWQKKIYRIHFADETPRGICRSLKNMLDVTDVARWGELQKGLARERFDKMSMQLSRIALIVERTANYSVSTQQLGRLKSVIIGLINHQLKERKEYVAKPYYAVRFKDSNNITFSKKEPIHFDSVLEATKYADTFKSSTVSVISEEIVEETPPKLLNLSYLSVALGKLGYPAKMVLKTYQQMYLAGIVSYPRTEETKISQHDFDELLPLVPKIAKVVNVDTSLLPLTTCRKQFLTEHTNHGANRPSTNVPSSLTDVENRFGPCGRAIYNILARSYLAILADNYVFSRKRACLSDYPDYRGTITEPLKLGYREVLQKLPKTPPQALNQKDSKRDFKSPAMPMVYKAVNPKPVIPSHQFVIDFLTSYGIGTGATQESTLISISTGKNSLIKNTKETYTLTDLGLIQATISEFTKIADPQTTLDLQKDLSLVENFQMSLHEVPARLEKIVKNDLLIMKDNVSRLAEVEQLKIARAKWSQTTSSQKSPDKNKISGMWNGTQVFIRRSWGKHIFTPAELTQLFADQYITFSTNHGLVTGKLAKQEYNGFQYVGFKPKPNSSNELSINNKQSNKQLPEKVSGLWRGQKIKINAKWGNHVFTPAELNNLFADKKISFYTERGMVTGWLSVQSIDNYKYVGFKAIFEK